MPPASAGSGPSRHESERTDGRQRSSATRAATSPSCPSRTSRCNVRKSSRGCGRQPPGPDEAAAASRSASVTDAARGLSTTTCNPASSAASASGVRPIRRRHHHQVVRAGGGQELVPRGEHVGAEVCAAHLRALSARVTTEASRRPGSASTSGAWKAAPARVADQPDPERSIAHDSERRSGRRARTARRRSALPPMRPAACLCARDRPSPRRAAPHR